MVLTTVNQEDVKTKIIDALLKEKLAACIQEVPISSHYVWDGQVQRDREVLLLIKSRSCLYDKIQQSITKHHNYDTPEIIMLPIQDGATRYLSWIKEMTKDRV